MTIPRSTDASRPRLALLLRRAWYGLNQTFRRRIAHTGVTPDQFTILRWLTEHHDGITQRALADLMASDANTITAILTRMQKAGLVERRSHERDARCNLIMLCEAGKSLHARLQPLASELQRELLAAVPAADYDDFLRHLEAVCSALDHEEAQMPTKRRSKKPG